jgi:hypothetical protein
MANERSNRPAGSAQPRRPRRIHEEPHDVYGIPGKLREPTVCPDCGAVYRAGRWVWDFAPRDAHASRCAACRRIADDYPAGVVIVAGAFASAHHEEILNLIRGVEHREKEEHPLHRLFPIENSDEGLRVRTTEAKLARAIGRALFHAYRGELEEPPVQSEGLVRVRWTRD